tara:strand:+ start:2817 stop:3041 length:225 start_codon:yes stop_codon:yes gene_type:complete
MGKQCAWIWETRNTYNRHGAAQVVVEHAVGGVSVLFELGLGHGYLPRVRDATRLRGGVQHAVREARFERLRVLH